MARESLLEQFRSAVQRREAEQARHDLSHYAKLLYPSYQLAAHHRLLITELEAIERGTITRLMCFQPPRHGKTLTAAQLLPAFYLGCHPDRSVIYASYSQEIADDTGRKVRNFLADPMHRNVFPESILSFDSAAQSRFHTVAGGSYFAVGRGGPITGRGAHLLILDDTIKDAEEARSDAIRKALKEWFGSVAYTRLAPNGAILLIQTRWHLDDLAGWLLREHADQNWRVLCLPAIAEEDDLFRKPGEALWPERYDLAALESTRRQLGGSAFTSLYQQKPVASEGQVFRREWWRFYVAAPAMKRTVLSLDSAFKTGQANDYSAIQIWGESQTGFYLLASWRGRVEFPELKRVLMSYYEQWRPNQVLVEDAASGQSLLQELRVSTSLPLKAIKPDRDKVTRAQACTPMLEAGRVFLPQDAPWLNDYLDELSSFPSAPHDDMVDATTMALNHLRGKPRTDTVIQFYQREAIRSGTGCIPELFSSREEYDEVARQLEEEKRQAEANRLIEQGSKEEIVCVNPQTGHRIKLDRLHNRWVDYDSGVPI